MPFELEGATKFSSQHNYIQDTIIMTQLSSNVERAMAQQHRAPLTSVRSERSVDLDLTTARTGRASFMDLIRDLWGRFGSPMTREGFSLVPVPRQPSGWRHGMNAFRRR